MLSRYNWILPERLSVIGGKVKCCKEAGHLQSAVSHLKVGQVKTLYQSFLNFASTKLSWKIKPRKSTLFIWSPSLYLVKLSIWIFFIVGHKYNWQGVPTEGLNGWGTCSLKQFTFIPFPHSNNVFALWWSDHLFKL